jgi:hypothetical protein
MTEAKTSFRERAKIDKERSKKHKNKGDISKKYSAYVESHRLTIYGPTRKQLKHNVKVMAGVKGFELSEVKYN